MDQGLIFQRLAFDHPGGELVEESEQGKYQPIKLYTDSTSGRAVLVNSGLGRRVRHMSIGVEFLQLLTARGQLEISWLSTQMCVADLLTKILPQRTCFSAIKGVLGFRRFEEVNSWSYEPEVQGTYGALTINQMERHSSSGRAQPCDGWMPQGYLRYLVIEMCTKEQSGIL